MSLELCVLASGSAGNCSILRTPTGAALIDAGIGPRTVSGRLNGTGVRTGDVRAICLTHLDQDHFRPTWIRAIVSHGITIFCHSSRRMNLHRAVHRMQLDAALSRRFRSLVRSFDGSDFEAMPGVTIRPIPLAHDAGGSHGFVIEGFGCRIGYATDLGHVPANLLRNFVDLDVLALESNYDRDMEIGSARPWFLKHRIMGGRGHLSNDQAMSAIRAVLDRCERRNRPLPQHIVLLHRSRQCNCPRLLRELFARDERLRERLTLAEQFQRSEWLRPQTSMARAGEQLLLSF